MRCRDRLVHRCHYDDYAGIARAYNHHSALCDNFYYYHDGAKWRVCHDHYGCFPGGNDNNSCDCYDNNRAVMHALHVLQRGKRVRPDRFVPDELRDDVLLWPELRKRGVRFYDYDDRAVRIGRDDYDDSERRNDYDRCARNRNYHNNETRRNEHDHHYSLY